MGGPLQKKQRQRLSMSKQVPVEAKPRKTVKFIFGVFAVLVLSGILTWCVVPFVRVVGYHSILIIGPVQARVWSVKILAAYGELAIPALFQALKDENRKVSIDAALALGKIGAKAVPGLIEALQDKNSSVRSRAAETLGNIGPKAEKAVPDLVQALEDEDWKVRWQAAEALGKIGPGAKRAVPALNSALEDKDLWVGAANGGDSYLEAAKEILYREFRELAQEAVERIKKK
jgi:hypothetical protein